MDVEAGQMYRWTDRSGRPGFWTVLRIEFCGGEEVACCVATDGDGLVLPDRDRDFLPLREIGQKACDGTWVLYGRAWP